jgi:hypothetical protein
MQRQVVGFEKNPQAFQYIINQLEDNVAHNRKKEAKVS